MLLLQKAGIEGWIMKDQESMAAEGCGDSSNMWQAGKHLYNVTLPLTNLSNEVKK